MVRFETVNDKVEYIRVDHEIFFIQSMMNNEKNGQLSMGRPIKPGSTALDEWLRGIELQFSSRVFIRISLTVKSEA